MPIEKMNNQEGKKELIINKSAKRRNLEDKGNIYAKSLVRLCNLTAPIVLILWTRMRKEDLFCYVIEILIFFKRSLKNDACYLISSLCSIYFNLT